jgi:hypothetical protein
MQVENETENSRVNYGKVFFKNLGFSRLAFVLVEHAFTHFSLQKYFAQRQSDLVREITRFSASAKKGRFFEGENEGKQFTSPANGARNGQFERWPV